MESLVVTKKGHLVSSLDTLVDTWLRQQKQTTVQAYRSDLKSFEAFMSEQGENEPIKAILSTLGQANLIAIRFKAWMVERGNAPSTVNRRLAALRSIINTARLMGLINWELEVSGLKVKKYRETAGPGRETYLKLLKTASNQSNEAKATRDVAILVMLHDLGLRRGEVVGLDLDDLKEDHVWILGKGRTEKERLSLAKSTNRSLRLWTACRGFEPGPLFYPLDRGEMRPTRLTGRSVHRLLKRLAELADVDPDTVRPHGIRHTAITTLLDRTGGDVRSVQRFSRHKKLETLLEYDDNRRDVAGEMSVLLAD